MTNLTDMIRSEFYATEITKEDTMAPIEANELQYHYVTGKHPEGKHPRKISRPAKVSRKVAQWKTPSMIEMVAVPTLQPDPWAEIDNTVTTVTPMVTMVTTQLLLTAAPVVDGFDTIENEWEMMVAEKDNIIEMAMQRVRELKDVDELMDKVMDKVMDETVEAVDTFDWVVLAVAFVRLVWSAATVAVNVGVWVVCHPVARSAAVLALTLAVWFCQVVPLAVASVGSVVWEWVKIQVTAQMGEYNFWAEYDRETCDMMAPYRSLLETYNPTRYRR